MEFRETECWSIGAMECGIRTPSLHRSACLLPPSFPLRPLREARCSLLNGSGSGLDRFPIFACSVSSRAGAGQIAATSSAMFHRKIFSSMSTEFVRAASPVISLFRKGLIAAGHFFAAHHRRPLLQTFRKHPCWHRTCKGGFVRDQMPARLFPATHLMMLKSCFSHVKRSFFQTRFVDCLCSSGLRGSFRGDGGTALFCAGHAGLESAG
jgi:hypothetical protein